MKRILIISEMFFPLNAIGAVRPTKISKYLTKLGYEVDVVAENPVHDKENNELFHNIYAWNDCNTFSEKSATISNNTTPKKHSCIYKKIYKLLTLLRNIAKAKIKVNKLKLLLNGELGNNKYDAVISSFGPLSSLLCGLYYKKTHPETKWICDFRDPVVVDIVPKIYHPYYRYLQNKACKNADVITTVSKGYFERICGDKYKNKAFMIPNGYDREDEITFEKQHKNEKMTFAYAGTLYAGMRDISPLFAAIRSLADDNKIDIQNICVNYAGNDFACLKEQARKYDLESILQNNGQMSRTDCLKFQYSSDILLLATWNDKNEIGVFPGKFLEYMLINKPIVALVSGDVPNSEVKAVMNEGNFGVVYEQATHLSDFENLKYYIKKSYDCFFENGKVDFIPNKKVVERYDYWNISKEMERLVNVRNW